MCVFTHAEEVVSCVGKLTVLGWEYSITRDYTQTAREAGSNTRLTVGIPHDKILVDKRKYMCFSFGVSYLDNFDFSITRSCCTVYTCIIVGILV